MWRRPRSPDSSDANGTGFALLDYGDTTDRYRNLFAYPSPHDGRMTVVAADGHGLLITVDHYGPADGSHDPLYGRVGGNIYNWNGGHPNGETDRPPRE
jgi:prepilin-type processing-associated H-X9-DG protein